MKLRSNFKFHECDKIVVFRRAYRVVANFADGYDIVQDGLPRMVLYNTRDERYGTDSIAGQLDDIALHSREAMVRTCLDVCRYLSGNADNTKFLVNGCYFLKTAIDKVWTRSFRFPENPVFDGFLEEVPQRTPSFYDAEFWSSSIVQSWMIVNTVYEWYELYMKDWARYTAEKIVSDTFY